MRRLFTDREHRRLVAGPRADSTKVVSIQRPEDWDQPASLPEFASTTSRRCACRPSGRACDCAGDDRVAAAAGLSDRRRRVPVEARGSRLWKVLHDSPNADQTPTDYWEFASVSLDLGATITRGSFATRAASWSRSSRSGPTSSRLSPDERSLGYRWSWEGKSFDLDEAEVFHVRGFGGGPLGGLSTLQYARESLGIAIAADRAAGGDVRQRSTPERRVLKFKDWLDADKRAEARGHRNTFAGAMNAGSPMILEGGSEWQSISINADDAQLLESRGWSVEDICRWFLTPPILIGHSEKQTSFGTGVEPGVLGFHKFSLNPSLRRIKQAIWKQLLTPAERAAGFFAEFNVEGLLAATARAVRTSTTSDAQRQVDGTRSTRCAARSGWRQSRGRSFRGASSRTSSWTIDSNCRPAKERRNEHSHIAGADGPSAGGARWDLHPQARAKMGCGVSRRRRRQASTITILEPIGVDFFGNGVTAKRIAAALRAIGNQPVTVMINSPGGDFFEGLAIYNLLREHPKAVTVQVIGIAASAASVIAMAGDDIQIGKAA
jgi:HK97 family phage portal protein